MRGIPPRSLQGQLIVLIVVALVLSQAAAFVVILNDRRTALTAEWLLNVMSRATAFADILDATPPDAQRRILKTGNNGISRFTIDSDASVADNAGAGLDEAGLEIQKGLSGRAGVRFEVAEKLDSMSRFTLLLGDLYRDLTKTLFPKSSFMPKPPQRPVFARLSFPLKSGAWLNVTLHPRPFAPAISPLLVQLATMTGISVIGIVLLIRQVISPLKTLSIAASSLGRGEALTKLDEKGPREVARTIAAFNEMQDRLQRFVQDRTRMLAALGHDLRTPITSLRLRAELIEEGEDRDKMLLTLDDMQQMVEATLSFARGEALEEEMRFVDIGALTSSVCADLSDAGHRVRWNDTAGIAIRCRPVSLRRALRNVIENAVSYGTNARISIGCGNGEVSIHVDDEGPGIPESEREKVFTPFTRLEGSRSRQTGGIGLGLAIARSIARSHGGDITLHDRTGGGLRVTLSLPLAAYGQGYPLAT